MATLDHTIQQLLSAGGIHRFAKTLDLNQLTSLMKAVSGQSANGKARREQIHNTVIHWLYLPGRAMSSAPAICMWVALGRLNGSDRGPSTPGGIGRLLFLSRPVSLAPPGF